MGRKRARRRYWATADEIRRISASRAQYQEARRLIEAGALPFEVKPAPTVEARRPGTVTRPFLGYGDDPMEDPRVEGWVELRHGVRYRTIGNPTRGAIGNVKRRIRAAMWEERRLSSRPWRRA